jgi:hypothetical protein
MPTLWDDRSREALMSRFENLTSEARPLWGKFTAARMLAHVNDALRMSNGDLATASKNLPLRFPVIKQLVVYALPWPKGVPTAPELLARGEAAVWEEERSAFSSVLRRFCDRDRKAPFPRHPAFGRLSRRAWGVLQYRHVDHHFRQFGA